MAVIYVADACRSCHTVDDALFSVPRGSRGKYSYCDPCAAREPTHIWCSGCLQRLPVSKFHLRGGGRTDYQRTCKACSAKRNADYRKANPHYFTENKFRLKPGTLLQMLATQNNKCAICGVDQTEVTNRLALDHNHETGVVRAMLCLHCNSLLGYAEDQIWILEAAISYLKEHS